MEKRSFVVNGVQVFSHKNVHSIVGPKVTFSDGSWCNVETGEIVAEELGSIEINSSVDSSSVCCGSIKSDGDLMITGRTTPKKSSRKKP